MPRKRFTNDQTAFAPRQAENGASVDEVCLSNSVARRSTVQDWIAAVGSTTAYIEPGSPWESGYCESFNAKLRDEFLDGEVFYTLKEASVVIEQWRRHYNSIRPHSSLGYQPPAPEVMV